MKQNALYLPYGCILRQATSGDKWPIILLVLSAKLDPTQLRWQQFWIIESNSNVIACGQLRSFSGVQELGSLVVAPAWRGRGLGSLLTQHLINQATEPLYLECLGEKLAQFYSHFGFVPVAFENLPQSLKRKFRVSHLAKKLVKVPVVFMEYRNSEV
ncbi:GNAT family N-acetyltransferase [Nostoc sp. FACHB-152]|uniref:GNAT family N-acetyltransferase n=1 Tax=unclassified Nostoc TaxID=2593658 RepID=UPI00168852C9|nr:MULTISPECIES: GNAT family N-acetyltransferase [unclassified Nostoc]MBD2447752.1 GNAT family N-acetyltransferase [Nostoc sp. FACHB-152]MBD2467043.1 GNAT family N-acetyltransferase [Nostoc sp. FACHB-145]